MTLKRGCGSWDHRLRMLSIALLARHVRPVNAYTWMTSSVFMAFRVLAAMGAIGHTAKFVRTQRLKHPTSVPLMLLLGHISSSQVRL